MKHRLWRFAIAIPVALALWSAPAPSLGYSWTGAVFNNGAIADGTLSICFGSSTSDGLYVWRGQMIAALALWNEPVNLVISSLGDCGSHPESNIFVIWGSCPNNAVACTGVQTGGYNQIGIAVNGNYNNINPRYYGLTPVPDGDVDMPTTIVHEVGHALGSGHSSEDTNPPYLRASDNNDGPNAMTWIGPTGGGGCHSAIGDRIYYLSRDDAWFLQQRYPGLTRKSGSWSWTALCVE